MSGGVRNLRAMFENKDGDTPDRGRSPAAGSIGGGSQGTSPRPLSKIRTSFVAVEKTGGQLGLKRESSGEPSLAKRRTSFSTQGETTSKETAEMKEAIADEKEARMINPAIKDIVPETAVETPPIGADKQLGDKPAAPKEETPKPASSKIEPKVEKVEKTEKIEHKKPATVGPSNPHANGTAKPAPSKPAEKAPARASSRPAPISTAKTATSSKLSPNKAKTPLPRTPVTPSYAKERAAKTPDHKETEPKKEIGPKKEAEHKRETEHKREIEHKKETERKRERAPRASSVAPRNSSRPASKPPTTMAHGSTPKTRIGESPPRSGFNKPRPKSPTRPVKLPASLTAHTASSGSKTATTVHPPPRQSLSRASGNIQTTHSLQAHNSIARSPSRASATAKNPTLTRKPSTLKAGSSRPSIGPPPLKKQSSRPSIASSVAAPDDSFLARMMRPTTASASKTAEKGPVSPPRRSQSMKRPTTRDGPKHITPQVSPAHKVHKEVAHKDVTHKEPVHAKVVPKEIKPVAKKTTHTVAPTKTKVATKPAEKAAASAVKNEKAAEKEPAHAVEEEKVVEEPAPVEVVPEAPVAKEEALETPAATTAEVTKPEVEEAKPAEVEKAAEEAKKEEPKAEELVIPEVVKEEPVVTEEPVAVEETPVPVVEEVTVPASTEKVEPPKIDTPEPVEAEKVEEIVPVVEEKAEENVPIVEAEKVEEAAPVVEEVAVVEKVEAPKDIPAVPETESEPVKVEVPIASGPVASLNDEELEDPEDVKAREEIARINAEFLKAEEEERAKAAKA